MGQSLDSDHWDVEAGLTLRNDRSILLCFVGLAAAGGLTAQSPSPAYYEAFDRGDRRARTFIETVQCTRQASEVRDSGGFGPIDSVGRTVLCIHSAGHRIGIYITVDSALGRPSRFAAVDLVTGARVTDRTDAARAVAMVRAMRTALGRGRPLFQRFSREFFTMAFRFDGDSIEVWLAPMPISTADPPSVGGEAGYIFSPDGMTLAREVDATADWREFEIKDYTPVEIVSREREIPSLTEFIVANIIGKQGTPVTLHTGTMSATLAHNMWIQLPRKP